MLNIVVQEVRAKRVLRAFEQKKKQLNPSAKIPGVMLYKCDAKEEGKFLTRHSLKTEVVFINCCVDVAVAFINILSSSSSSSSKYVIVNQY